VCPVAFRGGFSFVSPRRCRGRRQNLKGLVEFSIAFGDLHR
jgi:hypothetical protein